MIYQPSNASFFSFTLIDMFFFLLCLFLSCYQEPRKPESPTQIIWKPVLLTFFVCNGSLLFGWHVGMSFMHPISFLKGLYKADSYLFVYLF